MEGKNKMANRINATDFNKLRKLASQHGEHVRFNYLDKEGKRTNVDTTIDATTIRNDSLLTNNEEKGYRRYLFSHIESDVEVGE